MNNIFNNFLNHDLFDERMLCLQDIYIYIWKMTSSWLNQVLQK